MFLTCSSLLDLHPATKTRVLSVPNTEQRVHISPVEDCISHGLLNCQSDKFVVRQKRLSS